MKRNKKLSLKAWLSIAFLSFTALLIIALWLLQTVFLDDTYKLIRTNQAKSCANSISSNIESSDLESLVKTVQDQNDMAVTIYDVSSNIYYPIISNRPSQTGVRSYLTTQDILDYYQKAINNGGSVTIQIEDSPFTPGLTNDEFFEEFFGDNDSQSGSAPSLDRNNIKSIAHVLISESNKSQYLIIVECEITPVKSVVNTLRIQLIIVTIVMLILGVIIAIFTAKAISTPISKTNEKAKELAKQKYDVTFDASNYKEINELNDTLTYAASELGKVDTLRKELVSNVSHDLRTPLTMITGYAEVMRDIPGENNSENLQVIIDEASRLNLLVTDLLDISRLEAGTMQIEKNYFSITDCIEDIFYRYTKLIEQDGLNIVFEKDQNVSVIADELKITQVIYNLINNAITYIGEDNTVIVKQTVVNKNVRIEIIDHGEGIEEEKLPYIWDRYYKVDKEHKRAKIGTGLGLSIVKGILEAHNADYGVVSNKNEGSDFYFILPIATE